MKTRFIAAALVLISLWGLSAPLLLAASAKQTAASRKHACCLGGHSAFGLPISVSSSPATTPCGDQHPCCAKQAPMKPAIMAGNRDQRPGLESTPVWTIDGARNDRTRIAKMSPGVSSSPFLRSAVLRI